MESTWPLRRPPLRLRGAEIWLVALTMVGMAAVLALAPLKLALVFLVAVGFGLALLLWPETGLYALALVIPFNAVARVPLGPASMGPTDVLVAATFFAWFLRYTGWDDRRRPAPRLGLLLPFMVVLLYSTLAAQSLIAALPELVKWAEVIVVYWLAAQRITPRQRLPLALTLLMAGGLEALIGIRQFLFRIGPEAYLLGRFLRAYGTFGQPNPYAGYLGLLWPLGLSLSLWALLRAWDRRGLAWKQRLAVLGLAGVTLGLTGLIGLGIVVSWSRGAWLGVLSSSATVMVLSSLWGLGLVLALAAGMVVLWPALPPSITHRLGDVIRYFGTWQVQGVEVTPENLSVLERVAHWRAAWAMFADHFWLGIGVGNWDVVYPRYAIGIWKASLGHAHNVLFHYAAVSGIFGALTYVWLWLGSLVAAGRAGLRKQGLEKALAVGVAGLWVHLSIHNQFDNLWVQGIPLLVALTLALF